MPVPKMKTPGKSDSRFHNRSALRFSFNSEILCQVLDPKSNQQYPAWVADISAAGISFLLVPKFEAGSRLVIELYSRDRLFSRRLNLEVKHSVICFPNNSWLHGCAILEPLTKSDLNRLAKE